MLAVIVVLAIIMLIAIPAVLNTLEVARKKAFTEYTDKVILNTQKQVLESETLGTPVNGCKIYKIKSDLGLTNTGDYDGYVLFKRDGLNEEVYYITMWDKHYALSRYNYSKKINSSGENVEILDDLKTYNESLTEELSISNLCGFGCTECSASDEVIAGKNNTLYGVFKKNAESGTYVKEYTGSHQDSMNAALSTEKIYYWDGTNDDDAEAILEKNNVIFGGFCWQMIRTTDTGGVKLIYNGTVEDGKCLSSRSSRSIGQSQFNSKDSSLADIGYMYNKRYENKMFYLDSKNYKYSKSFTWDGSKYILDNDSSITYKYNSYSYDINFLNNNHYTCWNTSGECTTISFVYGFSVLSVYYYELTNGKSIEDAVNEMLYNDDVNSINSDVKTYIDNWYENNLISNSNYLEDTIFCNDRSQLNPTKNGYNPNGGDANETLLFKNSNYYSEYDDSYDEYRYSASSTDLSCSNETDKFSTLNNKAKLKYKIGLATAPEMNLLNNNILREIGDYYSLMSPSYMYKDNRKWIRVVSNYGVVVDGDSKDGVRPVVSLKPGTEYTSGDGSTNSPFIIN